MNKRIQNLLGAALNGVRGGRPESEVDQAAQRLHSTAPAGDGKQLVRMAAVRHSLTGKYLVINDDEFGYYVALCRDFHNRYRPVDGVEEQLVQHLVDIHWRLNCCMAIFTNTLSTGVSNAGGENLDPRLMQVTGECQAWADQQESFALLQRYETSLQRNAKFTMDQLLQAQNSRSSDAPQAISAVAQYHSDQAARLQVEREEKARVQAEAKVEAETRAKTDLADIEKLVSSADFAAAFKQTQQSKPVTRAPKKIRKTKERTLTAAISSFFGG